MKKEISIPLTKVENFEELNRRRDKYALSRDQQNSENNDAIAARLLLEKKKKCEKCGTEFIVKDNSEIPLCPACAEAK